MPHLIISLVKISRKKQQVEWTVTTQFIFLVTWTIDINFFESDETTKVLYREREKDRQREREDKATIPAPITRYVNPLALIILVCFSYIILRKSFGKMSGGQLPLSLLFNHYN